MSSRNRAGWAFALAVGLSISSLRAQESPDELAMVRVTQAMDQHYLATRFDEALAVLDQAIVECDQKCTSSTVARLYMYLGVVQGSGRGDQLAAREAFARALGLDADVTLDERFVAPETEQSFRDAGGRMPVTKRVAKSAPRVCVPQGIDVQTRRTIPVACRGGRRAAGMTLRYLPFRGDEWLSLEMAPAGREFRVEIPCSATEHAGTLSYYVLVSDEGGDLLDAIGSKSEPLVIHVDASTTSPAPSFPGQAAPDRCAAEEICPPDFPGCEASGDGRRGARDWQQRCESSLQCRAGLLCRNGRCEVAPSCDIDSDCATGVCRDGRCDLPPAGLVHAPRPKRHRLGLSFAVDVGFVGGRDLCTAADTDYECFERGSDTPYPAPLDERLSVSGNEPGDPYPGARMARGATLGTKRLLVDYGWIASKHVGLGARLGWAFGGGPSAGDSPNFLPLHAEARVAYWPLGVERRVQPRLDVAIGLAQVDLSGKVTVRDCSQSQNRAAFEACIEGDESVDPERLPEVKLEGYRKLGRGFAGLGGALVVEVSGSTFVEAGLRAMYLLPKAGFVLEPSVGVGYAF